ncbi:hypothetical protein B0A48_12640 [Cryoendolithus antarcticus]|uniref:J domain-containing protein n=1 Tax=Cryoendolithus antarcticus TaxID=1507870 RepID=A0A1V8SRF4_9PEZI|nr:hypothetical protein B0A48_12640 [Cryoendolithus antarcticus]
MSSHPSIETVRAWVARDEEAFRRQNAFLDDLQRTPASELKPHHRNVIAHWDRSIIKDCNRHLSILEDIDAPSAEERELMQQLNRLVVLGDHMVDRTLAVQAQLEAKLGAVDMSDEPLPIPKGKESVEEAVKTSPLMKPFPPMENPPLAVHTNPLPEIPEPTMAHAAPAPALVPHTVVRTPSPSEQPTPAPGLEHGSALQAEEDEPISPSDLYALLGVAPDIPFPDLKKAIRKQSIRMHPDKNLDDPDASSKFSDFVAAMKVFETEENRAKFEETGEDDQVDDLAKKVKSLKAA